MEFGRAALRTHCLAALLLSQTALPAAAYDIDPRSPQIGSHVRGANPKVTKLIARGMKRSPTFARLVEQLNASDVIVYVELTEKLPAGLDGRLGFMAAAGPLRYLHAQVRDGMRLEAILATAAHELQHALEIAAHPDVRDSVGMATLYQRIGDGSLTHQMRYDTAAARSAGRRVKLELS